MSKVEKYWLFAMVLMASVTKQETPTLLGSIGNICAYTAAVIYFGMMIYAFFRGEK